MTFGERLSEMLDRVLNEKTKFNSEWGELRRNIVEPRLKEAAEKMKEKGLRTLFKPNGGTLTLYAGYLGKDNYLKFSPDDDRMEVNVSIATFPPDAGNASDPAPDETKLRALAEFSADTVETIIMDFAALVAREGRRL